MFNYSCFNHLQYTKKNSVNNLNFVTCKHMICLHMIDLFHTYGSVIYKMVFTGSYTSESSILLYCITRGKNYHSAMS